MKTCQECGELFQPQKPFHKLCERCAEPEKASAPPKHRAPIPNIDCPDCRGTGWKEFGKRHSTGRMLDYAERCPCTPVTPDHATDCTCYLCYYGRTDRAPGLHRPGCECTWCQADGGSRQVRDGGRVTTKKDALDAINALRDEVARFYTERQHPDDQFIGDVPDEIRRHHTIGALRVMQEARWRMGHP